MRFWDSSAIVPLLIKQNDTARSRDLLVSDPEIAAWWATSVECASAIARIVRSGAMDSYEERTALTTLDELSGMWVEIRPSGEVRNQARRLLRTQPLRAGEAMQLAAAIVWSGQTGERQFITFDKQLQDAAAREGFI